MWVVHADLVQPNVNGLVFPAGNVAALTESLQIAFADRQRLQQWGMASHQIIHRYSYTQTTQGLKTALNKLGVGDFTEYTFIQHAV